MVFERLKKGLAKFGSGEDSDEEYIEIDVGNQQKESKVYVRPFILKKFEDVNEILNALREGYTIAVIDIKPLKSKDLIELKRAISKIKKTVEALDGSIGGFGENIVMATPQFAKIHKASAPAPEQKESKDLL